MFTVRAALQVPQLRAGRPEVVAGDAHLDRVVRWVHAGEAANMPALLSGGELLLTTGLGMGPTVRDQRRFVQALAGRGVAALAVELGGPLVSLAAAVLDEAEASELPLIAIHREVRFVQIMEFIHREIISQQASVMRRGEEVQQRLTAMLLAGAGLPEVLDALAQTIANPVVLERADRGVALSASGRSDEGQALAAWDEVRHGATGPDHISFAVSTDSEQPWGRLWALGLDAPLDDLSRVAVERAVGLIALELLRAHQEDVLAIRRPSGFLTGLMCGEVEEEPAREVVAAMGFDRSTAWLLPVVARLGGQARTVARDALWGSVWREARANFDTTRWPVVAGSVDTRHDFVLIVGLDDPARREQTMDRLARALHEAARRQPGVGPVTIGAGPLANRWSALRTPLREAADAAAAPTSSRDRSWRDAEDADLLRLLWTSRDGEDLRAFVRRRLEPLVVHDRERQLQLVQTLRALYRHGGHKAAAARSLHIERQSLYHRLERIEELLGISLEDEDTALGLHLAVRVLDVRSAAGEPSAPG